MVAGAWVSRAGSYPALRFGEVLRKWIAFYLKRKRWRALNTQKKVFWVNEGTVLKHVFHLFPDLDEIIRGDGGAG
jgi:hypothetical protein